MKQIYVTGANGFIGQHLVRALMAEPFQVTACVRQKSNFLPNQVKQDVTGDILQISHWEEKFEMTDAIIHLAGDSGFKVSEGDDEKLERINVELTETLARSAAKAGVKRFIFLSSAKVNGDSSSAPFTEAAPSQANDAYACSKLKAEQRLLKVVEETDLEVLILRPSMVYGKGAKGNFQSLIKLVDLKLPLPFGGIRNKRNLCSVHNLSHFISTCLLHPQLKTEVFLVADKESLSTSEIFSEIAKAKSKLICLVPIPHSLMKLLLRLIGKGPIADRLYESFEVDTSKAEKLLGWTAPMKPRQAFELIFKDK